ncbi:MAG: ThiF family adenylyltransferase [bacterium]|nr:ThiF family adenylyltransferase [bacterium]
MSQQLINHNSDLKQLRNEGYQVEVYGGHLVVHHIPYVTPERKPAMGVLVSELSLSGNNTVKPSTHVMLFSGEQPCNMDGSIITGLQHGAQNRPLGNGITINRSFSNKPPSGYSNYYEKVKRYAEIISAPAIALDETLTDRPFKPILTPDDSVFKYLDTNSSRANIEFINQKLSDQKIAIVGLGGTGAYVLDLVAKTCVSEIHLFDGDVFLNHNAFRSPGAASLDVLNTQTRKVEYYTQVYGAMRRKIIPHDYYVTKENMHELLGMDYVFLCIDNNLIRYECIEFLLLNAVSFIDVGLGVNIVDNELIGTVRVTSGLETKKDHIAGRIPKGEDGDNEYATNVQIAELNSLNATLAVLKWKKLSGFYQDLEKECHTTYSINVSQLLNEDRDEA